MSEVLLPTRAWISQTRLRQPVAKRKYVGLHCDENCPQLGRAKALTEVPREFWKDLQPCSFCSVTHPEWRWYPTEGTTSAFAEWWRNAGVSGGPE